jgi:hypothetical protein
MSVFPHRVLRSLVSFRYQHCPASIHIRRPTFTETVQVSHVYPVTSFVRLPPPCDLFLCWGHCPDDTCTALHSAFHKLGHLLAINTPARAIQKLELYPLHPFTCFWRHTIAPKIPTSSRAPVHVSPEISFIPYRLTASLPLTNSRILKLHPGHCTLTRVWIFSILSFISYPTSWWHQKTAPRSFSG